MAVWLLAEAGIGVPRIRARHLVTATLVATVLPHVLKQLLRQRRPYREVDYDPASGIPSSGKPNNAFPSGHALHLGAVASSLSRWRPDLRLPIWSACGLIGLTRILLLAHWASDVFVGFGMGAAIERAVVALLDSEGVS